MVIFFFTDMESSTSLWEKYRQDMVHILQQHDAILYETVAQYGGRIIEHTGDGIFAVFNEGKPLHAALEIQRQMEAADWSPIPPLRVRIGMEGRSSAKEGIDYFPKGTVYFGPAVNLTNRIMSAGWGGQILVGNECLDLVDIPAGAMLQDLGRYMLRGTKRPQQIFSLTHPDLSLQEFPPLRTSSLQANNLPEQNTPFIDRVDERAAIARLLKRPECRLLNLLGPGGIGKSSLSMQAARENVEIFADGVYFVPLAPVQSADYIVPTIADSLRLSFYNQQDSEQQLFDYLREKEMLLLVDNVEHVVEGVQIFSRLLQHAPQVKIMTTSRVKLNIREEWSLDVSGMATPRPGSRITTTEESIFPAVELFLQAAQRARHGFSPTPDELAIIGDICHRLQGMPLAIELAASWLRLLSVDDIAREIEQGLDFLSSSVQGVPERHRSLRAVFDYSWDLLDTPEQQMLGRLSIFRGGFNRTAAQSVARAGLPALTTLHDKSLIIYTQDTGRYEVHELLRQYATDRLQQDADMFNQTTAAHSNHFLSLMETQLPALKGNGQQEALHVLSQEQQNLRAAWYWAWMAGDVDALMGAFECLILYHVMRNRLQDIGLFFKESPVDNGNLMTALWYTGQGIADYNTGRYQQAKMKLNQGIELISGRDPDPLIMLAHYYLGGTYLSLGEYTHTEEHLQIGLRMARALKDNFTTVLYLHSLGVLHRMNGNYDQARELHQEGLVMCQPFGNKWLSGISIYMLGYVAFRLGNFEEAERLFQESVTFHEQIGDDRLAAFALNLLGNLARQNGAYDKAHQLHLEALTRFEDMVERRGMTFSYLYLGQVAQLMGNQEAAQIYLTRALQMALELDIVPLILQVLGAAAGLLVELDDRPQAMAVLNVVANHPSGEQTIRDRARQLLQSFDTHADQLPEPEPVEKVCGRLLASWASIAASSSGVIL